jgi:hypothetical protein
MGFMVVRGTIVETDCVLDPGTSRALDLAALTDAS